MCFFLIPYMLMAQEPCSYRVVAYVEKAAPLPPDEDVREITAIELCPRGGAVTVSWDLKQRQKEQEARQKRFDACSYIVAGTIRVIVGASLPDTMINYEQVLSCAKEEARKHGIHGLRFHERREISNGYFYNFWGGYRKGEVPPEFKGFK
jgi:hypothetical protein